MDQRTYTLQLMQIVNNLPEQNRTPFLMAFQASEKNPVVLYGFNMWLGWLGIDRFLVGDIVAGLFKLITFGGFGIWQIIDCFLIGSRGRTKNMILARTLAASYSTPPAPAAVAAPAAEAPAEGGETPAADGE